MSDQLEARVAGSDTREAAATPTVRSSAAAAAFMCAPGWAAAFAAPSGWRDRLGFSDGLLPWMVIAMIAAAALAGLVAFRRPLPPAWLDERASRSDDELRLPPVVGAALVTMIGGVAIAARDDLGLALIIVGAMPPLAGWAAGRAARTAVSAVAPRVVSAASGIVLSGVLLGLLGAVHIVGIAGGSGIGHAARWSIAYAVLAAWQAIVARVALPADARRVRVRAEAAAEARARRVMRSSDEPLPPLVVESLTVGFDDNVVLNEVSADAKAGEVVALVGANGAGKSTLLRTVAGFVVPRAGRVIVSGDDVSMLRAEERADAGLAFVSGARPIFPDLSVQENLRVAAFRSHLNHRSFAAATDAVLDLVPALANRRKDKAGVLSGGEQRLLAVAQALYRTPSVLLADELSLGLDLHARIAVLDLVRMLADDGVCVVVVDHDLPTLLPRADRAILLAGGSARSFAEPVRLLDRRSELLPATFLVEAAG